MPTINIKATGENIAKMRKSKGITVKALQNALGFSTPQAIYKWQQGVCMPTIDNLVILAAIFDCRIDDIIITNIPDGNMKIA